MKFKILPAVLVLCLILALGFFALPYYQYISSTPVRATFAWAGIKEDDIPTLTRWNIDTVYLCADDHGGIDIEELKEAIALLEGFDVYLLTGESNWGADKMTEIAASVSDVEGLCGIVFDIEPRDYDDNYAAAVETACLSADVPIYMCYPYWIEEEIANRVIAAADGSVVMAYYKGKEKALTASLVSAARKARKPMVMAYELQAPDGDHIPEQITYDGDVSAALENYEASFPRPIGVALHWLKQP